MATNQSRTFDQLITAVSQLGLPDPDGGVSIGAFINEEYKLIAGERRWEWLQGSFTFPTVVGTLAYNISSVSPGDVRNFDALWITDAQAQQYLIRYIKPLQMLDLQENQPSTNTGPPQYWSVYAGQVLLWPTPNAVYTAKVAYVKSLGDVPLTTGVRPLMPGDYDTVLVWGAAAMVATRLRDWLSRDFMGQQRDRVLANMRPDYQLKQRQNSDEVQATGIWSNGRQGSNYYPGW